MIFLYALTMNALTLSMIDNFVHAFAVVCKLLTLKLIYTPYVLSYFKRLSCFYSSVVLLTQKNAERSQAFYKSFNLQCMNNNLFKGKKHQSFTLMITLCVQSDLGPNCMPTPFLVEQNCLCNSGRGHHEEHFCEII